MPQELANEDSHGDRGDSVEKDLDPGADLEPEEAADALKTKESAHRARPVREDRREDEDLISLDTPD